MPAITDSTIVKLYDDPGTITNYDRREPLWTGTLAAFRDANSDSFPTADAFHFEVVEMLGFHGFARFGGGAAAATILIAQDDIPLKLYLAHTFADVVKAGFSPDELATVIEANKTKHTGTNVCATHDVCDANMLMLEAFTTILGREPHFLTDADADSDTGQADMRLWSEAWAIAKEAEFFA